MTTIVFFGSSNFSAQVLKSLTKDFLVSLVVTKQPMPVGRNKIITKTPVAELAELLGIPCITPTLLKDPEVISQINNAKPDILLVVAYGKIIPQVLLDIPTIAAINIHGSLLPNYRGASPIHAALYNGDKITGITVMLMDAQMDHGAILKEFSTSVSNTMTFPELEESLTELAVTNISPTITEFIAGAITPVAQVEDQATFTKIITKEDGRIDWNRSATEIYNQFRAYISWPGIWTTQGAKKIAIKDCRVAQNQYPYPPGTVVIENNQLFVQCNANSLELLSIQPDGKNPMKAIDFINGHASINHSLFS